jgi:tRNA pseudouridine55 synthase
MRSELNGILVIDKPAGQTSAKTVAQVKKIMGIAKCGHTGTLDPLATGVLICCMNQATRLARFFLHGEKAYQAVLRLGTSTDTQDGSGRIMASATVPDFSEDDLVGTFKAFEGQQLQQPPVYAALKHQGTPLYKLARQGRPVQKAGRPVTIRQLRILRIDLPDIEFQVTCSAGTYIRTLCADIGDQLGCGGHLYRLRRTASSGFSISDALTPDQLKAEKDADRHHQTVISMADALGQMPSFTADDQVIEHIRHGRRLNRTMVPMDRMGLKKKPLTDNYIMVVNANRQLKAVIQPTQGGRAYDYCCVFH